MINHDVFGPRENVENILFSPDLLNETYAQIKVVSIKTLFIVTILVVAI